MSASLVIVESPTKAKTIARYLGKAYRVESSFGHVRDLPKSKMGIDVDGDFAPNYVVPADSKKVVTSLKAAAKKADAVYFATDEDREGEAISWHLQELLGVPADKAKRITFHEITKGAIEAALEHPRTLDIHLVDAQQARRVLDRLVGYELSPFLWKKVRYGLSAGRVQSVAVRLIVEREREVQAFTPQEYWTIEGAMQRAGSEPFPVKLAQRDGKALDKFAYTTKESAKAVLAVVAGQAASVADVVKKTVRRTPPPPFTTSTLQQDANRRLGFSARKTMTLAQRLYEGVDIGAQGTVGLITYMRTDSLNLSTQFQSAAQDYLKSLGDAYATGPKSYKTKAKGAQEAHEAIRPTDITITPEQVQGAIEPDQARLYDLIWRRAVASQMPDAELDATTIDVAIAGTDSAAYTFRATGQVVKFDGYSRLYPDAVKEAILPDLATGDAVEVNELQPLQHFTEPPARYSEASLVKALEEHGIGRPSTYAPTIATVIDRGYVTREERRLKPTDTAFLVNDLLVEHFPEIVDISFTAKMESDLDEVAEGKQEWVPLIRAFYTPFKEHLVAKEKAVSKKDVTETATDITCEKCGKPMVIKFGRFGKFLACTGYPECKNTKPLNDDGTPGERPKDEPTGETCPECKQGELVRKVGRFGPFFGCNRYPDCKYIKNIEKKTGVTCPECGKGDIVEKRSKRGKTFYSCNRYPACTFALWSKPTGETCPESGDLLVYAKAGTIACSKKGCPFTKQADDAVQSTQTTR